MEILKLLQSHPLNGIALLAALFVIVWCLLLLRRIRGLYNRALTGLVGMTAVFQGLRLLQGTGLLPESRTVLDDMTNLLVTSIYLASLFVLRGMSRERSTTELALRLAEGNQARPLNQAHSPPVPVRGVTSTITDDLSRVVLDVAPIPMFAVGLDGNVNYWNHAAEQVLGWSRDEVLGHKLPILVLHPGDDPFSMMAEGPIRLVRKDGARFDQSLRSVPIRDSRGALNGILTIVSGLVK